MARDPDDPDPLFNRFDYTELGFPFTPDAPTKQNVIDMNTAPPDPRLVEVALQCGPHSAALLRAIASGDWAEVDRLEVPELTAQVDGWHGVAA